ALLFLGSGSVIHGTGTQDVMEMGGLRKSMPKTFWTFLVGTLALAGFPWLFSGFWSKEEILLAAYLGNPAIFWILAAGAFLTAFYMMRLVGLTFGGDHPRNPHLHAHESPANMWVPLACLAFLSLGWWKLPMEALHHLIDPNALGRSLGHAPVAGAVGMAAGLLGLALGWAVYWRRLFDPRPALMRLPLLGERLLPGTRAPGVYTWVKNKYYFDEFYWAVLVQPLLFVARAMFWVDRTIVDNIVNGAGLGTRIIAAIQGWIDRWVVDGAVNAVGWTTGQVGQGFRRLQNGLVQNYVLITFVGLVAATGLYLYYGFR
ncbi:MAG: proton-conducting transporter membrane subunit, partial [Armatimonadota bacterium]|nr:proton-conducting transporter membrane subunit [Armatimonadota bacterium]